MPKVFDHDGYKFFFYSNEHEPPNCHVTKAGQELRIEFHNISGAISLKHGNVKKKRPFPKHEKTKIVEIARGRVNEILEKWNTFFNEKKQP